MTDAATRQSLDGLFQKWQQVLANGQFTTATLIAAGRPDFIDSLQRRINDYISARAADLDQTLTESATAEDVPEPPDIPGYVIERHLGRGGMGHVWQVRDELDRPFALKMAHAHLLSEAGRARFLDEARAMARLDHPHIASIHHPGRHGDVPFFLMPIYPASLRDRLAEYQGDPVAAVRLMAAVADGVGHLHAAGLVHRDLKPGNVLLDAHGQPAVSDFGLVKTFGEDPSANRPVAASEGGSATQPGGARPSRTVAGFALGTRSYMSPEQAAGLTHLANPRWDVWALGVMLHQLLTAELPRSSGAPEKLLDPAEPDNPPPSDVKPGLDPRLERIIQKCLTRDERERYADGREVSRHLNEWLRQRDRKPRYLLLLTCLLLAAAVAAVLVLRNGRPEPKPEPESWTEVDRMALRSGVPVIFEPEARLAANAYELMGGEAGFKPNFHPKTNAIGLATTESVLLVLCKDPGVDAYRFEAEINQSVANPFSQVGLFQGLQSVAAADGDKYTFAALKFNLHTKSDKLIKYWVGIMIATAPERNQTGGGMSISTVNIHPLSVPEAGKEKEKWHRLSVEVRAHRSTWRFGDEKELTIPRPLEDPFSQALRDMVRPRLNQVLDLPPSGGLGVIVQNSACQVRNIKLTPAVASASEK